MLKIQMEVELLLLRILVVFLLIHDSKVSKSPIINTKLGKVKGSTMKTRLGRTIYAFRGIRYAEPPIGQFRFKSPIPVSAWNDTFDASEEGPACPQVKVMNMSEDCLTLNVYTRKLPRNNRRTGLKLPVIVFLHPGGFYQGSSQSYEFGPHYLLDEDVVLVTINYRLGSLGFINTGDNHAYGNYGFKDQVSALRFIQDNIAAFGGDQDSVTLTGQSAGSRSIVLHMISPMSKGLFHRAIAMSGSMTTPIPAQKEQADLAMKQAKFLNCTTESFDIMFECLMNKSANDFAKSVPILSQYFNTFPITIWYPSIEPDILGDDRYLSDEQEKLIKLGIINSVPLIIGMNKDEFGFFAYPKKDEDIFYRDLNTRWHELAPIVFQYEKNTNRSNFISDELYKYYFNEQQISQNISSKLGELFADALVNFPVYRAANLLSEFSAAPVYFYNFAYKGPYIAHVFEDTNWPKELIIHAEDLQYLFKIDYDVVTKLSYSMYNTTDPEILMVKRLTSIWAHFAKTSEPLPKNPDLYGNITWAPYTMQAKKYLHMNETFTVETDYLGATMELWDKLFP